MQQPGREFWCVSLEGGILLKKTLKTDYPQPLAMAKVFRWVVICLPMRMGSRRISWLRHFAIRCRAGMDPPEYIRHRHNEPVIGPGIGQPLHDLVGAGDSGNQQNAGVRPVSHGCTHIAVEGIVVARGVFDVCAWHVVLPVKNGTAATDGVQPAVSLKSRG